MSDPGFVMHVRAARRNVAWMVAAYILAFQMVGGLAGLLFIGIWDPENTILANPLGYFARYGFPMALIAAAVFASLYFRHAETIAKALAVDSASALKDRRFLSIAEQQCVAQGIRAPRFGVLEVPQLNALAVGEGPERGLIAVTRGLLDHCDDEELAAVLAHEAAHIRNGDTRILAANHALMRTAVGLQVNNPLRFEDWRILALPLLLPPFMVIMLASGFITMISMRIARQARRGINLSRDFAADAAAVRATHFPDALISALHKVGGRSAFSDAGKWEDILFDGKSAGDGGCHPEVNERIAALHQLAGSMLDPARVRRDSRPSEPPSRAAATFGRRGLTAENALAMRARHLVVAEIAPPPPKPKPARLSQKQLNRLLFSDFKAYKAYLAAWSDYSEWRETDDRDLFGLRPEMRLPVAACFAFLLVFHWPSDGNFYKFAYKFSPRAWADVGVAMQGTHCSGPSYPDGKCT
ncbi:M48 family metalloprotease [Novosphingobium sp. Gsoil 351]|uniref:M48 family metalloprotease n=1 Tax=Novosphingobium sp. Gsoil 351 TaxID=2675225 RepID=UPI0012B44296|nr:M48 family metalloprotease [Novosphingobium sp. Gsoil 351]QGN55796.1 M48 family metalloprotease [Novosphingobium sp. Gsoil 351]